MGGAAQVAMRVASQIWQVVFASQTLQVFCLAIRKKAQYVVVPITQAKRRDALTKDVVDGVVEFWTNETRVLVQT
jgi:hypothetical protein